MYRMLAEAGQTRERRDQLIHPSYSRPELLASAPNRLWSWDITKLLGPAKWTYFYLYVVLDVFSRYVVGWMLAHRESAHLAKQLIADTCRKQKIAPGQLTVHADRGSSMTSKPVAFLLSDLGVTKTHSRPHFSNDNPYSESQFRTMKYRPGFPDRFGSIQDARIFAVDFFRWYNEEHHHSGISLLTPAALHYGRAPLIIAQRQAVLDAAYIVHYTENATVFGQQTENNIRLAILSMPPGSILIAWQGTRPGRLGSALVFVHEFSLYLRAPESASVGYEDIFNWLVNDVPSSGSLSTCHRRSATRL